MPEEPASKQAWKVEASSFPNMTFEQYRSSLIYETPKIRDFLSESQEDLFVISAPKGFGKTLLLIAKRKQLEENRAYRIPERADEDSLKPLAFGFATGGAIVDRPRGPLPEYSKKRLDQLGKDYAHWKTTWWISIMLAALKLDAGFPEHMPTIKGLHCEEWITEILLNRRHYNAPAIIFTSLLELDYSVQVRIFKSIRLLNHLFDGIRSPIAFFIDNVDEYFKPILENRSIEWKERGNTSSRNKSNDLWTVAQIALAATAYEIHKSNNHIKIFCTIRQEAFTRLEEFDNDVNQIKARTVQIEYSRGDFYEIFYKNILLMKADSLNASGATDDLMQSFFGQSCKELEHRLTGKVESAFDFVLRHTFYRPRDLMMIGQAIAEVSPKNRSPKAVMELVDKTTDDLVTGLMSEMRPFFPLPSLDKFLSHLDSNVIAEADLGRIADAYKAELVHQEENEDEGPNEYHHPFCVLQKIGMIGWIETEHSSEFNTWQRFIVPREVAMKDHIGLPRTEGVYLIHPALDHLASKKAGGRYFRNFHKANIVGNDLPWTEPATSLFVVRGDLCGFSEVMTSEFYRSIARKIHEWAEVACKDLDYCEVSGGDSVLMIDRSAERILNSVAEMLHRAASFNERPLTFRFGGAVGPISFETLRRCLDGKWETMILPLGLALRTSARLEPHAPKGTLIVEEKFIKLRGSDSTEIRARELDAEAVKSLRWDVEKKAFLVQKNADDPAYETKLFLIEPSGHYGGQKRVDDPKEAVERNPRLPLGHS